MPIYKMDGKKDGLQKYRVRINYTDNLGVQKQLDRVAYGKDAAKELESRLMRNLKEETGNKITVADLCDEYIRVKRNEIRESTLDKQVKYLNKYVIPFFNDAPVEADRAAATAVENIHRRIANHKTRTAVVIVQAKTVFSVSVCVKLRRKNGVHRQKPAFKVGEFQRY